MAEMTEKRFASFDQAVAFVRPFDSVGMAWSLTSEWVDNEFDHALTGVYVARVRPDVLFGKESDR